jgi:hypothetical protein
VIDFSDFFFFFLGTGVFLFLTAPSLRTEMELKGVA